MIFLTDLLFWQAHCKESDLTNVLATIAVTLLAVVEQSKMCCYFYFITGVAFGFFTFRPTLLTFLKNAFTVT